MKNSSIIAGGSIKIFRARLKEPFITALGQQIETFNVALELRLAGGARGYGEASGSIVAAHLRPAMLAAVLRKELRLQIGRDAREWKSIAAECWGRNRDRAPAAAAFECALGDALAKAYGFSLLDWFGGARRELETDLTISAASPQIVARAAAKARTEGFRLLKIKVGTGPVEDLERAVAVRDAAPKARLILDGNQGLTAAQALKLAEACAKRGLRIVLFEQPLKREDLRGMAWLRRRSPFPIAADESVRSARDAFEVLDRDAADVINVKVAKTGLHESLEIVALARAAGKRLMVGCMRESLRGLAASAQLACGTGAFDFVDLDSDHLLAGKPPTADFFREGATLRFCGRASRTSRNGSPRRR